MSRCIPLALLLLAACEDTHVDPAAPDASVDTTPQKIALAATGDFDMTGVISKLDLSTMEVTENIGGTGAVSGDPVVRHIGGRIYIVNRAGGASVTVLDANTLTFIDQYGTGGNSNPQDVAVVGTNLYVPALGTSGVVKINTVTLQISTIDLSALDPADGLPDCTSAYAVGSLVYVSCGTLDEFFSPRGPGKVAIINTADDSLGPTLTLPEANPYNFIVQSPADSVFGGDLLLPLLPSFTNYDVGCIARITPGQLDTEPSARCAEGLDNSDIGGTAAHIDVAKDGSMLWMAVGTLDQSFSNPTGTLKGFDLRTGQMLAQPVSPSTQMIQDVAACSDGSVVVADGTFNASGLRVYRANAEVTTTPLAIGLPPTYGNAIVCYETASP